MVVVPIRSGLGLRLGANFGYLKFTKGPTWNPFLSAHSPSVITHAARMRQFSVASCVPNVAFGALVGKLKAAGVPEPRHHGVAPLVGCADGEIE